MYLNVLFDISIEINTRSRLFFATYRAYLVKKSSFVNRNFFWYTLFLKCKTFACLMILYNESDIHAFIYQKPP